MVKHGYSLIEINDFTIGELICHTEAANYLINIDRLEKYKLQVTFNPNLTDEGRQTVLKALELEFEDLKQKYDNLE